MTKILMTADTIGGVWTYAVDLCRALGSEGVEVALATMGGKLSADQRKQVGDTPHVTLYESTFRLEWMANPWNDVERAGDWLLEIEEAERPDVVHLNGYAHGALPWRAPVLMVGHSCVLSWWEAVKGVPAPGEWDDYRQAVARGLAAADIVVAPSRAMLDALCRHYGPLAGGSVIPNGRDPAHHAAGAKERFILSAGRLWDEAKNLALLDEIAPRLPWPLRVAGETAAPQSQNLARARHVQALGRLGPAALAGQMARAAIYALPARYEPFGLSALEAALSGCALVLGDIGSLREVWGDAALFVAPTDADAWVDTLVRLIDDQALRRELGRRAASHARQYTSVRMANAYLAAYRQLCRAHPGTRSPRLQTSRG